MALWLGEVIRGWAGRVASWLMQGVPLVILWRREASFSPPVSSLGDVGRLSTRPPGDMPPPCEHKALEAPNGNGAQAGGDWGGADERIELRSAALPLLCPSPLVSARCLWCFGEAETCVRLRWEGSPGCGGSEAASPNAWQRWRTGGRGFSALHRLCSRPTPSR